MRNNVTLYISTHNQTGLKHFGKTTLWFDQKALQENYLKKHGNNVTMQIYGIFSLNEDDNNWANLILENGLDGGWPLGKNILKNQKRKCQILKLVKNGQKNTI